MATLFNREKLAGLTNNPGDFFQQSAFSVELEGKLIGGITRVEGLNSVSEVVEYQDSDDHLNRGRAGNLAIGTLTLTRNVGLTKEFYDWYKTVRDGATQRIAISLIHYNDRHQEVARTNLFETWPKSWALSGFNSKNSGQLEETIEIMYERSELK